MPLLRPTLILRSLAARPTRAFSTSPISALARLHLIGRLAAAPELIPTASGQDVVRYAVGTSYGPKEDRKTSWFKCASFQPEGAGRDYLLALQKGTLVFVDGDASMRTFEDKEGNSRTGLNVTQRTLEVLKRPEEKSEDLSE